MMKRRLLSTLMALCMALALIPAAFAEDASGYCGDDLAWTYSNGTLTIQGTGSMEDYSMSGLVPSWFDFREEVHTVKIGNGVTRIGNYAFYLCENLTSVTIPGSVASIGESALSGCTNLTSVTIPDGVTSIESFAFAFSGLTSVTILASVTTIEECVFYLCPNLASVTIPASVTTIRDSAFSVCPRLTDVYYSGSESQWNQISIEINNDNLTGAAIHYTDAPSTPSTPATPSAPTTPSAPSTGAVLSPQKLTVDGKDIDCEKYNIGGSNYFKLRDLAQLLDGTGSQFGVGYDEASATVTITTGEVYKSTGTELATGVDNSATAQPSGQSILIDGVAHSGLTAYNIGGSNFFQLRELGNILGFEVDYDVSTDTAIVRSARN